MLDRICSAFYRFQCSGMANAKNALGGCTTTNLDLVFTSQESTLKDLFTGLWKAFPSHTCLEDALHEPEVAAAGFLKRYAPYVFSGLESAERSLDAPSPSQEAPPLRRSKKHEVEEPVRGGMSRRRAMKEEATASAVIASSASLASLRREIKGMTRGPSRAGRRGEGDMEERKGSKSDEWQSLLPLSMKCRLDIPLPDTTIGDLVDNVVTTRSRKRRLSDMTEEPEDHRGGGYDREGGDSQDTGALNGAFSQLGTLMESTPALTLWANVYKRSDGYTHTTLPRMEDFGTDPGQGTKVLGNHSDLSPVDWEIMQGVFRLLKQRGIDQLWSSSTGQVFDLNVDGVGYNWQFQSACQHLEDDHDTKKPEDGILMEDADMESAAGPVKEGTPSEQVTGRMSEYKTRMGHAPLGQENLPKIGKYPRRNCLRRLKHFLEGYAILERDTTLPVKHHQCQHDLPTVDLPQDLKKLLL